MKHALTAIASFLFLALLSLPARAADARPDEEGFIRDWLMLAPASIADTGADEIDKKQIADEGAIKPKAGDKQKVGDKELEWKAIQAGDYHVDFNKTLGSDNENVVGYLVAYVVADKAMPDLTLLMGCNDQGKVYLNRKEVVKNTEGRTLDKDSDKAEKLTLNKGVNVIVFKVINESNNWEGCLRFKDKEGKPVTGYTVKTAP
ncbi:MAG: acetyl xylan esterase [Phycisphaerales bacterium]|nr:acetyl xylan esterase [Phycisphaerales bacterium]